MFRMMMIVTSAVPLFEGLPSSVAVATNWKI
jgi:hypothetical protein